MSEAVDNLIGKLVQPHQERVLIERTQLQNKLVKLSDFSHSAAFATLDPVDQYLLSAQHRHMCEYLMVLELRIARFT